MPERGKKGQNGIVAEPPRARPFSPHENETLTPSLMRADGGVRRRGRAGPACAGDAAGPDRAAIAARAANCAPMQPAPHPGTAAPEGTTTGQRAEPLGDKLARSDGVLCPPAGVDPEIARRRRKAATRR